MMMMMMLIKILEYDDDVANKEVKVLMMMFADRKVKVLMMMLLIERSKR